MKEEKWYDKAIKSFKKAFNSGPKGNPDVLEVLEIGLPKTGHVVAYGHFTSERG